MSNLYLVRGLPGSGKTTFARKIADVTFEADSYFIVGGEYRFNKDRLTEAHTACQNDVRRAMIDLTPSIAVANTFTRRWEMEVYIGMAREYGYIVTETTMSGPLRRNIHGVPGETIELMRKRWEY